MKRLGFLPSFPIKTCVKYYHSSGLGLGQMKWDKNACNYSIYDVTHIKPKTQNPTFFCCRHEDLLNLLIWVWTALYCNRRQRYSCATTPANCWLL